MSVVTANQATTSTRFQISARNARACVKSVRVNQCVPNALMGTTLIIITIAKVAPLECRPAHLPPYWNASMVIIMIPKLIFVENALTLIALPAPPNCNALYVR